MGGGFIKGTANRSADGDLARSTHLFVHAEEGVPDGNAFGLAAAAAMAAQSKLLRRSSGAGRQSSAMESRMDDLMQ
jgi:hypothetical protein